MQSNQPTQDCSEGKHAAHKRSILPSLAIGGGVVIGAVVAAPYVLPVLGLGNADIATETAQSFHSSAAGAAEYIKDLTSHIPIAGEAIAAGGWANTAAAIVSSAGGIVLGGYVSKKTEGKTDINWGKLIKMGGLVTSALIAMPMLLTSLTTGIAYMTNELEQTYNLISYDTAIATTENLYNTIGTVGGEYQHNLVGTASIGTLLPHLFTCGTSVATGIVSAILLTNDQENIVTPHPKTAVERLEASRNQGLAPGAHL